MFDIGTQNALILLGVVTVILGMVAVVVRRQLGSDHEA